MIKRLKKVGNGHALFLDRTLMDLVGLREGGEVQVRVDSGSLILTPTHFVQPADSEFQTALENVVARRREVLQRLAE